MVETIKEKIMGKVTEMLGIEYPILCGAMGGVSRPDLVIAVAQAGGMGILATAGSKPERVLEDVQRIKAETDKPFGANIMLMSPNYEEVLQILLDEGVRFFTTGAGNPIPLFQPIHDRGGIVFPVVPSARVAKKMEDHGADGVIVEGTEAGGHVGEATTMTLTRLAAKAVNDIPVIAAGGIADGHGLVAAYALGAAGVQLGTVFAASKEAPIHENYKQAIINATDTSTFISGKQAGVPIRIEKNEAALKHIELDQQLGMTSHELESYTLPSLVRAAKDGNITDEIVTYGQIAGLIEKSKSVKEIIEGIVQEAEEVVSQLDIHR